MPLMHPESPENHPLTLGIVQPPAAKTPSQQPHPSNMPFPHGKGQQKMERYRTQQ